MSNLNDSSEWQEYLSTVRTGTLNLYYLNRFKEMRYDCIDDLPKEIVSKLYCAGEISYKQYKSYKCRSNFIQFTLTGSVISFLEDCSIPDDLRQRSQSTLKKFDRPRGEMDPRTTVEEIYLINTLLDDLIAHINEGIQKKFSFISKFATRFATYGFA